MKTFIVSLCLLMILNVISTYEIKVSDKTGVRLKRSDLEHLKQQNDESNIYTDNLEEETIVPIRRKKSAEEAVNLEEDTHWPVRRGKQKRFKRLEPPSIRIPEEKHEKSEAGDKEVTNEREGEEERKEGLLRLEPLKNRMPRNENEEGEKEEIEEDESEEVESEEEEIGEKKLHLGYQQVKVNLGRKTIYMDLLVRAFPDRKK